MEGWVVGPRHFALGDAGVGLVGREDLAAVGAAGVDAVFVDEPPTICSRVRRRVGSWRLEDRRSGKKGGE